MRQRRFLSLALDPAQILCARSITPDPWQRQFLLSSARQVLLNCSRQSGKSTTVAALALHTALFTPGSLVLLLSPSLRQSAELFRKIVGFYKATEQPVEIAQQSRTQLELKNESRIVSLPGKEATVRSFSGVRLLVIDEAARVPDDLYRSVRPMLAVSQGRLVCLSTPFGKRGFFFHEWTDGDPSWQRIQITWKECPRISAEFIEQETRSMGESWVRQEYLCSFEALEGLVYPDFEEQCAQDQWPAPLGKAVGGIDFGFRNPFCALWGVLDRDGVLWIDHERYLRGTPIQDHAAALPRNVYFYADPAGASDKAALRCAGLVVRKGNNDIQAGIGAVSARLRTGGLKVHRPSCPNLLAEAKLYRYPQTPRGEPTSEIPIDAHNHALAALRYLVSRIDAGVVARFRRRGRTESEEGQGGEMPGKDARPEPKIVRPDRRYLSIYNEDLWTRLF
jgi:Terminase large subunit, T4likevirus-type, N-terminal